MTPGRMVIDGRFELLEQLGSGGMGTVWRAYDLALQREVALKEVRASGPEEQDPGRARMLRERVLREARALARLHHPNVVTIHHIVDAPNMPHPWIVMELVRGRSLQDLLARGPLPPAEAARLGRGILAALRTAHAAGICHRDVKPANVLLRPDGSPVLTDFGIAALHDSPGLTASGDVVGSPEYIAPERLRGQEGNPASDLWSLGMLLYVAVEGRHPMRRDTPIATLAAVLNGQLPPPRQAGPLTNVLRALLVPDPAARPQAAELDWMLAQASGQISAADTTAPGSRPGSRRGRAVTIAGVAGVGAILTTVLVLLPRLQDGAVARSTPDPSTPATATMKRKTPATPTTARETPSTSETEPESPEPGTLLTPSRIRDVIGVLEKEAHGAQFADFTVYDDFARAKVLLRGSKKLHDILTYRDGQVSRDVGGSLLMPGEGPVRLGSFNWNALPALLRTADRKLGVRKPTSHYVTVEAAWPFADNQPVLLVYVMDDYGGGYLAADRKGNVLKLMPR
ncbi:serine/threonine-protein kinase [Nonomuraea sp. NPDC005983]|uniref:serine/threonine-protein kinase n=1 Tax=Nonomuraea sp. NPDC005983 TaxID=3155595 RepID=UPI0033B735EC